MKVGIITYHRAINYGAFLQAYALCEKLNSEINIDAEIIDFSMKKEQLLYGRKPLKNFIKHPLINFNRAKVLKIQKSLFEKDRKKMRLSNDHMESDNYKDFINFVVKQNYDLVICGSDEVWKLDGIRGFPTPYWLIGNLNSRKFAYAVSSRSDFSILSESNSKLLKQAINDFEYIGVRDSLTFNEVKKVCNDIANVNMCCDPTFLYDYHPSISCGKELLNKIIPPGNTKKVIGVMVEDYNLSNKIYKALSKKYCLVSLYLWQPKMINGCKLSPFEWIDVMAACDCVISSFFHAACFAIKHKTPNITLGTIDKRDKLDELVKYINNSNFQVYNSEIVFSDNFVHIVDNSIKEGFKPFINEENLNDGYYKMIECINSVV